MKEMHNRKFAVLVLLGLMLIPAGCARQRGRTTDKVDEPVVAENTEQVEVLGQTVVKQALPTANLFIENSTSMNSYVIGFKPALKNLVVDLKSDYTIGLNFINKNVINQPIGENQDPLQVVSNMLDKNFTSAYKNKADLQTTRLNDIIKLVLERTNDSTVSILVSDCIYSIKDNDKKKTKTNEDKLKDLMVETKNQFIEHSSINDLSVLFIRLESNFNGQYYDCNDKPIKLTNRNRPYYMCVIGTDNNVKDFMKNIRIKDIEGYACHYYISGKNYSNTFYTAINRPYKSGSFIVEDGTTLKLKSAGSIQFAIAMNLDDFSMSEEEKTNPANYEIDGNFNIEEIHTIDNNTLFSPNEKNNILSNGCTHLVVVKSNGFPSDFTIKFKPSIPEWVNSFSSTDDIGISDDNEKELKKTFGISYFINGVAAAFERDSYFTMSIKIKH